MGIYEYQNPHLDSRKQYLPLPSPLLKIYNSN